MAREMKYSGVKWIGKIPNNWNILSPRYWVKQRDAGNWGTDEKGDEQDAVCIRIADFNYNSFCIRKGYEYTIRNYPKGVIKKLQLRKGDIIIEKSGGGEKTPVGRAIVYDLDIPALFANFSERIRVSEDYSNIFMLYAFAAHYALGLSSLYFNQTTGLQNLIMPKYMREVKLPLPPLPEQKAIADFLDKKCAEIDGLLADLEAEVKTLAEYKKSIISEVTTQGLNQNVKKKQSGIDWVGNIPAHWQVVPFRSYVVERTEKNLGGKNKNLLALSFALGVTRYADKKYNMDRVKDDFCGYQIVHEKDLVLSPNDIIKGSIFVSEYKGCISPMYRVFSNYDPETYNLYYLSYHLRTKESGRKFFYIARGLIGEILDNGKYVTRRMSVSQQDLLKFKVLLPPIEEQNEIVHYLDEKCVFIEQAIADKQTQIETLKAYKSSLIYEYVTGKKQVI